MITGLGAVVLFIFFQLQTVHQDNAIPALNTQRAETKLDDESANRIDPVSPTDETIAKQSATKTSVVSETSRENDPARARHLLRSREVMLDQSLAEIASAYRQAGLKRFALPAFDGDSVHISIRRVVDHDLGGTVLSGQVVGEPSSRVTLAEKDGAVSGAIRWPKRNLVYEVRPLANGSISIGEVDLHALGQCGLCAKQHLATQTDP